MEVIQEKIIFLNEHSNYSPKENQILAPFTEPGVNKTIAVINLEPFVSPVLNSGKAFINSLGICAIDNSGLTRHSKLSGNAQEIMVKWEQQGVLFLNFIPTIEIGETLSHFNFWEKISGQLFKRLSIYKPLIWVIEKEHVKYVYKYINKPLILNDYSNLINNIPITDYHNYILIVGGNQELDENCFLMINMILQKQNKKKVNF